MKPLRHANIEADPATLTPLYDCVLVERIFPPVQIGSIHVPEKTIRPDEMYDTGLRKGRVVAVGRGDRITKCIDPYCPCQDGDTCHYAGPDAWPHPRHFMPVAVGDVIVYTQVPDNDVVIGGKPYTLCRAEQHIYAVLEDE